MRVLYIGGTGEISHACVKRSVDLGHDVAVFNRGRRGREEPPLPPSVRQIVGDLADGAAYAALGAEGFDVVCQFLAYDLPAAQRDVEVFGEQSRAVPARLPAKQYVFISTASAYQKPPRRLVVTEDVPLENPYWAYSRAKADMEAFLLHQHAAGRLPVTIVRPSHTLRTRLPGGIARGEDWAWRMLHGRAVIVQGDGTSLWTITHSSDFAVPFCNLLGNSRALGQAFHITRHMESYTWEQITAEMGAAVGAEAGIVHVPTDTLVRYNPDWAGPLLGDKAWSVLFDNSKVMSVAGAFTCRFSLAEMLALAGESVRRRLKDFTPDPKLHALLDRICVEQTALGG
jgi:nucleoside-diphosphate-sugar epimerase